MVVATITAVLLYFIVFVLPTADSKVNNEPVKNDPVKQESVKPEKVKEMKPIPPTEEEKADEAVYKFIVGTVEADDDLRKTVVSNLDHDILEPNHHAFPGDAEIMGERYTIKRFNISDKQNKFYYYIEYFYPSGNRDYAMNLRVIKEDGEWKSDSLVGIPSGAMKAAIAGHESEGVLVHDYKE